MKKKKCVLMPSGVTYLRFRINKNGVNPLPRKLTGLLKPETTKNVMQLKMIFGYVRLLP